MTKITPTAGLYLYDQSDPPTLTNYPLGDKPTLIDGDKTTEFGSQWGYNKRYESHGLDLGSAQTVVQFIMYDNKPPDASLSQGGVNVLYGNNNSDWTLLEYISYTSIPRSGNAITITLTTPTVSRYWRLHTAPVNFRTSGGTIQLEFTELEAYDGAPPTFLETIVGDARIFLPSITFSGSITGGAYILEHSTANPYQFDFTQPAPEVSSPELSNTAFDLNLKHVCNHVLSSGTYTLVTCPRCLGKGYYYDIKIDELGLVTTTTKTEKLLQELEKITLTDSNPFHPGYGAKLLDRVGQIPIDDLKTVIYNDLLAAVNFLRDTQEKEAAWVVFSPNERILRVERILIYDTGVTALSFVVEILTFSGVGILLKGTVTF